VASSARATADHVAGNLGDAPSAETLAEILRKVQERQKTVGYPGDYSAWIEQVGVPA
jgi:hypothetical protein